MNLRTLKKNRKQRMPLEINLDSLIKTFEEKLRSEPNCAAARRTLDVLYTEKAKTKK